MPFTKITTSQHCHYDAVACVVYQNRTATENEPAISTPFGICVVGESATEFLEFNTQRWWPLPHCNGNGNSSSIACAIASVGSHIYQVGGLRGIPNEVLASCHTLQFGATEWSEVPRMEHARCYAAAIGIGSLLYVVGGRGRDKSSDSSSSSYFTQLNSLEVYDTETKSWETKSPMSTPRMAPGIIVLNATTIAVIGGYSDCGEWETSIEFYDIPTDTWTTQHQQIPAMPTSVAFPKAVAIISNNNQNSIVEQILVVGTCTLRPRSPQDTYTTIWMLHCGSNSSAPTGWIKLISSNPKNRHKVLLPNEGCAISLDPNSNTLYSIGGRAPATRAAAETMSKQVLAWHIPHDESTLANDLQVPGFGLPLLGLGGNGHVLMSSRAETGYHSISPRKQRQQLQRHMLPARNFADNRRGSNTFSATDSQVDVDGGSYEGSATGDGYTDVTSPLSTASRRYVRRQDDRTPKTISLGTGSSSKNNIDEEDDEPVTTIHVMNFEWTDRMGTVGRYTGSVRSADSLYPSAPQGKGTFVSDANGDTFEGEWKNGRRNGQGRWTFNSTGDIFEGMFSKDRKNGRGNYQWRDGRCFEGNYENDQAEDLNGILTWKNGTLYVGAFRKGQRTGKGTIHFPSNNVKYSGEFRNGKYDGYGTCTFEDSKVYTGYWKQGKAHGTGKLVEADGTIIFEGAWEDDAPVF